MEKWGTAEMASTQRVPLEAHNIWLNVLGQTGILGAACFAAFLWLALRGSTAATPALFCGVLATLLYHGLFAALEDARHLWLLLGLTTASARSR
jgi:O-antigen ligase